MLTFEKLFETIQAIKQASTSTFDEFKQTIDEN